MAVRQEESWGRAIRGQPICGDKSKEISLIEYVLVVIFTFAKAPGWLSARTVTLSVTSLATSSGPVTRITTTEGVGDTGSVRERRG
jgi:hypothetical protein